MDYDFTKHYLTKHKNSTRDTYLVPTSDSSNHACYQVSINLQGCVKPQLLYGKHAMGGQGILLLQMDEGRTDIDRSLGADGEYENS